MPLRTLSIRETCVLSKIVKDCRYDINSLTKCFTIVCFDVAFRLCISIIVFFRVQQSVEL